VKDAFIIDVQLRGEALRAQLRSWIKDCSGLRVGNGQESALICIWDWAHFLYQKQLGNSIPKGVVVISHESDPQREQQVLVSGAIDYISAPIRFENLKLRLSLHIQRMQYVHQLESLSITDTLTGLYNRRKFEQARDICWRQGIRQQSPCSILLLDVDHFKSFNDTYGHLAGDQCLRELAQLIQAEAVRPHDVAARIGGEEFAVLLPDTPKQGALHVANRIIERVRNMKILNEHTEHGFITMSAGVACITPTNKDKLKVWQQRADEALYAAKASGRNQVQAESSAYTMSASTELF
jgi:diguanylate cyclase (GGDEF)-like protein